MYVCVIGTVCAAVYFHFHSDSEKLFGALSAHRLPRTPAQLHLNTYTDSIHIHKLHTIFIHIYTHTHTLTHSQLTTTVVCLFLRRFCMHDATPSRAAETHLFSMRINQFWLRLLSVKHSESSRRKSKEKPLAAAKRKIESTKNK